MRVVVLEAGQARRKACERRRDRERRSETGRDAQRERERDTGKGKNPSQAAQGRFSGIGAPSRKVEF
eukprot:scaffold2275_cov245-Pinguiococcus_pyrenoidosus.AAC.10